MHATLFPYVHVQIYLLVATLAQTTTCLELGLNYRKKNVQLAAEYCSATAAVKSENLQVGYLHFDVVAERCLTGAPPTTNTYKAMGYSICSSSSRVSHYNTQ